MVLKPIRMAISIPAESKPRMVTATRISISVTPARGDSRFIAGLNAAGIEIDRRQLADLAVNDAAAFGAIVAQAQAALAK